MLNSLRAWHDYFIQNRQAANAIGWNAPDTLTAEEKACIGKSLAAFQLGEYSEGKGLMKAAADFAQKHGWPDLIPITKLFIGEEQTHALLLKRFMALHQIELLKKNWTDTVFRRLRKNVGFELSLTVLITAEIVSLVYYKALQRSTNSLLLKGICDKILADEIAHTEYESAILNHLRQAKPAAIRRAVIRLHQFFLLGTVAVVYWSHKPVLNRGGYDLSRFFAACWLEFSERFVPAVLVRATARVYQPEK